jgi:hypothetical protein
MLAPPVIKLRQLIDRVPYVTRTPQIQGGRGSLPFQPIQNEEQWCIMKKALVFVAKTVLAGLLVVVPIYLAVLVLLKGMKSVGQLVRPFARSSRTGFQPIRPSSFCSC